MVSREPQPGPAPAGEGGQEKAMTVRSVLLNRDSPDTESRLKRRRNRTHQVRFKDLVEGSGEPATAPGPNTPRASPPPRDPPEPVALCASRRSWPQAQPGSLTLPMPRKVCMNTAIQTSPSLHKPFPASQPRSKSVCDVAGDAGNIRCPRGAVPTGFSRAVPPRVPGSLPTRDGAAALPQHAAVCHVPPPPPRDPCPPYPGAAGCPAARCAPELCPLPRARLRGNPGGSRGTGSRPASVPCGQPWLPTEPRGLGRSDSEQTLPRGHPLSQPSQHTDSHGLHQPAQGSPPRDPPPPQHQLCHTPWGGPCCISPAPVPLSPGWHISADAAPEKTPAVLCHLDPHDIGRRIHTTEPGHGWAGPEGPEDLQPPAPQDPGMGTQPARQALEVPQHSQPCLTARQSETLRHVQDLLQLVVVTKGPLGPPAGNEDTQTSQGEGRRGPGEPGDLQSQLQSLEGVLETSQQTIRVLLDVIQDLEKKEAQRDGRHSYRTGQDIANCGTCRDCACIIYSVEHDFRQQEGRFQRVLSHIEGDMAPSSPTAGLPQPQQELSPVTKLPAKLDAKKSRRKCFWFL
ncbi:INSYN2B protein-like [Heliangelus exortis]|uniref:INSYN2B protein-like n=1 Tax=Heliangelus exortis TaxID=472823 RepID=UPI003A93A6C6